MDPTLALAEYMKMMEQEKHGQRRPLGEVSEVRKNNDGSISAVITIFSQAFDSESMFRASMHAAITETIQKVASVIINERRAEIEAACNFDDLRQVLAAELARQFMASRLGAGAMGNQLTTSSPAYPSKGITVQGIPGGAYSPIGKP